MSKRGVKKDPEKKDKERRKKKEVQVPMEKEKPLLLTSDLVFKAVYGRDTPACKEALIAVLNVILDRKKDPITDLVYRNPFIYAEYTDEKTIIMDIKAVTNTGEWLGIEMQMDERGDYIQRNLFYHAQLMTEQLESGEEYDKIRKTIAISIVRGPMMPQSKELLNLFVYKEKKSNFELTELSEIYYLLLCKIDETKDPRDMTELERLGAFIRYANEPGKEAYVEKLKAWGEEAITMSDKILKRVSKDERLRQMEEARKLYRAFERMAVSDAEERGEERLAKLMKHLFEDGRSEELQQALSDPVCRKRLFEEYGI